LKVEVATFTDGRLKILARFEISSNFWADGNSFTWVPTLDEVKLIAETLFMVNEHNIVRKGLGGKLGNYR
jgi:hypothetical protein